MQSLLQSLDRQPDVDDLLDQAQVRHPDSPLVLHQPVEDDPLKAEKEETMSQLLVDPRLPEKTDERSDE